MSNNTQILDCVEGGAGTCRNADAIEQLRAARAALEAVEWIGDTEHVDEFVDDYENWCPWCGNDKYSGHAADCARQVALGKKPEDAK